MKWAEILIGIDANGRMLAIGSPQEGITLMRVTHNVNHIKITDGPGSVKLLDAYIAYTADQLPIRLTFHGYDDTDQERTVTVTLDGPITRLSAWSNPRKELIGYAFNARLRGQAITVRYWLARTRNEGGFRGMIYDAVEEAV